MATPETHHFLIDGESPAAGCRIQDLPQDQRPREKLALLGPAALANDELMALFISTGMKGLSAIDIGRQLLRKFGSLGALGGLSVAQLAQEKGLGLAKASKLAAAFELGSRVAREQLHHFPLDTPQQIYALFGPQIGHLMREQVIVAVLDSRLRHIGTEIISIGSLTESNAHPREIFKSVITRSGHSFILVHNHPSGDSSPSRADETLTSALLEGAVFLQIKMQDHVIIGRPTQGRCGYFSFREAGLMA